MTADPTCHPPMPLLEKGPPQHLTWKAMVQAKDRRWLDKLRALALAVAARFLNFRHPWDGRRVSLKRLQDGDVRLVFSVLFVPDTEMDTDAWPHGPPADRYFKELTERLDQVNGRLPAGGAATPGPLTITSHK